MSAYRRPSGGDPISQDAMDGKKRTRRSVGCFQVYQWVRIVLGCGLAFFLAQELLQAVDSVWNPHREAYLPNKASDSTAVKALFTDQTVFDVEATLWLNVTGFLQNNPDLGEQWRHLKVETYPRADRNITEAVVFNGIVFSRLNIHSEGHGTIRIRLPSAPFFQDPAFGPHLRSSFTLVPRSDLNVPPGSKLIEAHSALPLSLLPGRAQAGVDIRVQLDTESNQTKIADLASLLGIASAEGQNFFYKRRRMLCPTKGLSSLEKSVPVLFLKHCNLPAWPDSPGAGKRPPKAEEDLPVLMVGDITALSRNARYISTRNRIAIRTKSPPFKRDMFLSRSMTLARQMAACVGLQPHQAFPPCDPARLLDDGASDIDQLWFSTYAEFSGDSQTNGTSNEESVARYAPAMITLESSRLPKYRLELPDFDTEAARTMQEAGVIEYNWELYFAPISTALVHGHDLGARNYEILQDRFPISMPFGYVDTVRDDISPELMASYLAFNGDRSHPDSKPWRHVCAAFLTRAMRSASLIFTLAYWASRGSTVGISIPATLLTATSHLLQLRSLVPEDIFEILYWILLQCWLVAIAYFQVRTALRLEMVGWRLRIMGPTHKERASSRLDTQPLWLSVGLPVALVGLGLSGIPDNFEVRAALGNPPQPEPVKWAFFKRTGSGLQAAALIRQLWFNHTSRTFAGGSHFAIFLYLAADVGWKSLQHVSAISGHLDTRRALTLAEVFTTSMLLVQAYQALVLLPVDQNAKDEDEE